MKILLKEIRHNRLLWLLAFVPVLFAAAKFSPEAHTLLFVLSVLAIVPLAALLSHATESVAAKTGDAAGGLLNATLGNLTELVIALTALRAGEYMLVKASIAGALVTNTLFMLGASFLLGGLKYHAQEYNQVGTRLQSGMLFLATVALLIPSLVTKVDASSDAFNQTMSLGLAVLLIVTYGLSLLFSLKTHREFFAGADHAGDGEAPWPLGLALSTLAGVTLLVALVSEIFVESVQKAAEVFGMTPAFVGFIVVALVGGAAEMSAAFSAARKNRLDLSVGRRVRDEAGRVAGACVARARGGDERAAGDGADAGGVGGGDASSDAEEGGVSRLDAGREAHVRGQAGEASGRVGRGACSPAEEGVLLGGPFQRGRYGRGHPRHRRRASEAAAREEGEGQRYEPGLRASHAVRVRDAPRGHLARAHEVSRVGGVASGAHAASR